MGVKVYIGGGGRRGLHSSPQAAVWCRGNMNWSRLVRAEYFLEIFHQLVTTFLFPDTDLPR